MGNRLADAISPYLRAHADNPVDWWPWGADAFAEARRRDVPVLVSIGYATCHWCHVMARESFSDPELARWLNAHVVAVKVDREELPDVDAAYLAGAGAFTRNLGWPLTAFVTPAGRMFYAGTYFPPEVFRRVLEAVWEAWTQRRDEVDDTAGRLAAALAEAARQGADARAAGLPDGEDLDAAISLLAGAEDRQFGGFGQEPKFPVAPALTLLLGRAWGRPVALRTLETMAGSGLRDPVEGGFFRYATRRDWSEPHYERMLYDNAQLLRLYADAGQEDVAAGIASFLSEVLRAGVGFASAQDSESVVAGERTEGGYYRLDAAARARETPPALDRKVLAGWNGLAIGALAHAGARLGDAEWVGLGASVADELLAAHLRETPSGPRLARASLDGRVSEAPATLEDYGMLADGLIDLALATGEVRHAESARRLVDATRAAGGPDAVFAVPGGGEPVLTAQGLALDVDPSEGAYPSGWSATARAAHRLHLLTGSAGYEEAARAAVRRVAGQALANPLAFGAILDLAAALEEGPRQLVIVGPDGPGAFAPALWQRSPHELVAVVTDEQADAFAAAGYELFEGRAARGGVATAYACTDFVCELPITDPDEL